MKHKSPMCPTSTTVSVLCFILHYKGSLIIDLNSIYIYKIHIYILYIFKIYKIYIYIILYIYLSVTKFHGERLKNFIGTVFMFMHDSSIR